MEYLLILAAITIIFWYVGKKSNLLRDTITDQASFEQAAAAQKKKNPKPPFSLSRSQLAFWTVIVTSSFFYLWMKNGFVVPVLDQVNIILLGISMGTTAAASVIDSSQNDNERHQNQPSAGFLQDIISDSQGASIHRLQNVLWTVIMGIIYIQYVATHSLLPDSTVISDQILILMGISSGAYLGLKIPENSTPGNTDENGSTANGAPGNSVNS